jgi:hypothetical protein
VKGLTILADRGEAAALYPLVLEAIETGTIWRWVDARLLQTVAGIAAAVGRQWDKAEEHYKSAMRYADDLPHRLEQPEVRR